MTTIFEVPCHLIMNAALDTSFVAHFALFLGVLLIGTLVISRVLAWLFKLPIIAGQIIGGLILGPSILGVDNFSIFTHKIALGDLSTGTTVLVESADLFLLVLLMLSSALTVAFLLWHAGYETDLSSMKKVGFVAVAAGVLGALVPIALTVAALVLVAPQVTQLAGAVGIGLVFAATSVSIPVAMLLAQRRMHLRSSQATLGAAVIDDIVAVLLVSFFMLAVQAGLFGEVTGSFAASSSHWSWSLARMGLTLSGMAFVGYKILPILTRILVRCGFGPMLPAITFGVMLLFFAGAEMIGGLAGITGAYFAGLFYRQFAHEYEIEKELCPFINAVLLPIFLGTIGMQVNLRMLSWSDIVTVTVITTVAVLSKFIGVYSSTALSNVIQKPAHPWTTLESYLFGASMVARGEVGLVISTLLRGAGLIDQRLYVICIVGIVLTTIMTPLLLAIGFKQLDANPSKAH